MALQRPQEIYSGAALLIFGSSFTKTTTDIVTTTTAGVDEVTTTIPVTAGATIASHAAAVPADPPICDIICNTTGSKREIVACYAVNTNDLSVVRGLSEWYTSQKITDTTYNQTIASGATLQNLGYGTFPDKSSGIVFTNNNVKITGTYETFQTRDNIRGISDTYISKPTSLTLECTIPRNTIPQFKNAIGRQRLNDLQTANITYMSPLGNLLAGTKLATQFIIIVPLEQWTEADILTVGANTFLDFSRAFFVPKASLDPSESFDFNEGSQLEVPAKFMATQDDVFCMPAWQGWYKDAHRLLKHE